MIAINTEGLTLEQLIDIEAELQEYYEAQERGIERSENCNEPHDSDSYWLDAVDHNAWLEQQHSDGIDFVKDQQLHDPDLSEVDQATVVINGRTYEQWLNDGADSFH